MEHPLWGGRACRCSGAGGLPVGVLGGALVPLEYGVGIRAGGQSVLRLPRERLKKGDRGGARSRMGLLPAAGGAYWPLAIYRCPSLLLNPSPSASHHRCALPPPAWPPCAGRRGGAPMTQTLRHSAGPPGGGCNPPRCANRDRPARNQRQPQHALLPDGPALLTPRLKARKLGGPTTTASLGPSHCPAEEPGPRQPLGPNRMTLRNTCPRHTHNAVAGAVSARLGRTPPHPIRAGVADASGSFGRACRRARARAQEARVHGQGIAQQRVWVGGGGGVGTIGLGGGGHKASVSGCLHLAVPIGLSPLLILTLCGPERVLVVSTEPPDDSSCLTTPGVGCCPGDGLLPVPLTGCIPMHPPSPCGMRGFADSSTDLSALGCASAGSFS